MQAEQLLQPLEPPSGGAAALQQRLAAANAAQVVAPPVPVLLMQRTVRWQRPVLHLGSALLLLFVVSYQPAELTVLPDAWQHGPALRLQAAPASRDQLVRLPGANVQMNVYWKLPSD